MSRVENPGPSRMPDRLQAYLDGLTKTAGHADRVVPTENYTKGLMLPIERKSEEPMAARPTPGHVRQMHQSLHHIVADASWSDEVLLNQVRRQVLPAVTRKLPPPPGLSMTQASPKRERIRSQSRANIAVSWQAGELPLGGERVACHRAGQYSGNVSALSS